jgi:hypothetical protein
VIYVKYTFGVYKESVSVWKLQSIITPSHLHEFLLQNNSHDVPMPNTVPADEVSQQQELSAVSPDDETHSSANEWENVSRDTCQWSLLIGQLEDVALLDTVLR